MYSTAALDNEYRTCGSALPIRTLTRDVSFNPDQVVQIDPRPAAAGVLTTTNRTPPNDGFFEPAPYKGAFGLTNWGEGWSTTAALGFTPTCNSTSGVGARPGEVTNLRFSVPGDRTLITFDGPPLPGAMGLQVYDTLRSTSASSFAAATLIETNDSDERSRDAATPPAGTTWYYVVRAGNACGEGTIGYKYCPNGGGSCTAPGGERTAP
jgi:hypothetical protein